MIVYFNGRFLPKDEVRISPEDRGFMFADGIYEVIRAYDGRLFRADEHLARMNRSLEGLRMDVPTREDFKAIAGELIRRNNLEKGDARFYLQVTRGEAERAHSFPAEGTYPTVYASVAPLPPNDDKLEKGVKVILVPDVRWTRCDIKTVSLLPNVLASQQAKENNAEEAVFVKNGVITEGAHTNFFAVFGGRVATHPSTHEILSGITRGVVLELCKKLSIPCEERPVAQEELKKADEIFIASTTSEVMPVVQVDDWTVAGGKPGEITVILQKAFRDEARRR